MLEFIFIVNLLVFLTLLLAKVPQICLLAPYILFFVFYSIVSADYATDFANNISLFANPLEVHLDTYLVFYLAELFEDIYKGHEFLLTILLVFIPLLCISLFILRRCINKSLLGLSFLLVLLSCSLDAWGSFRLSVSFFSLFLLNLYLILVIGDIFPVRKFQISFFSFSLFFIALGFHKAALLFAPITFFLFIRIASKRSFSCKNNFNGRKNLFAAFSGIFHDLKISIYKIKITSVVIFLIAAPLSILIISFLFSSFNAYLSVLSFSLSLKQVSQLFYFFVAIIALMFSKKMSSFYGNSFLLQLLLYFLSLVLLMIVTSDDVLIGRFTKYGMIGFTQLFILSASPLLNSNNTVLNRSFAGKHSFDSLLCLLLPYILLAKQFAPLYRNLISN